MALPSWSKLIAAPLALSTLLLSACVCGPGPNQGGYDDEFKDPPKSLQGVKFVESEKGPPEFVGCADGQREGFADVRKHRRIAGCLATWQGVKSLRDKPTGKAGCGDDGELCNVPADACAPGWHICGADARNTDLKSHTSWRACEKEAGPGKFVAAMSHGQTDELCPPPPTPTTEFPCMESGYCAEPVCCGEECQYGKCRDAVWRGKTKISLGKAEGCGAVTSERNGGVLCCYDGPGDPADPTAAQAGATEGAAATESGGVEAAPTGGAAPTGAAAAPDSTAPAGLPLSGPPSGAPIADPTTAPTTARPTKRARKTPADDAE